MQVVPPYWDNCFTSTINTYFNDFYIDISCLSLRWQIEFSKTNKRSKTQIKKNAYLEVE